MNHYRDSWYLFYYTSSRRSRGRVLITKISYECTWIITSLYPKGLDKSMLFVAGITSSCLWLCLAIKVSFSCVHISMLPLYNEQLVATLMMHWLCITFIFMAQVISRYCPNHSVTVWYQIYQPINFFDVWLHWVIRIIIYEVMILIKN